MQGRNNKVTRSILAAAAVAVVGLSAVPAKAQLQYGDVVTINTFQNSSYDGRIYRHNLTTGQRTQIGSDWTWTERPQAVLVESANTILVAAGTQWEGTSRQNGLYRVDVTTGTRTLVGRFSAPQVFGGNGQSGELQPLDIEKNPVTGEVYLSTGITHWTTGQSTGRVWRLNTQTAGLTQIGPNYGWERAPTQMAIDPTNPNRMYIATNHFNESYDSQHYYLDLTTGESTYTGSRQWHDRRVGALEFRDDGQLYAGTGTYNSSNNSAALRQVDKNNNYNNQGDLWNFGWEQPVYHMDYDSENDRMFMASSFHRNSPGSYTSFLRSYNLTTGSQDNHFTTSNADGYLDVDVWDFGTTNTARNNVSVTNTVGNVSTGPNFNSTNANGAITPAALISALSSANSSLRTGYRNANNQQGNLDISADITVPLTTARTLSFRATNDLTVNNPIVGTGSAGLSVNLVSYNDNSVALDTGLIDVNANVTSNGGAISLRGKSIDIAAGTSLTSGAGAISLTTVSGGSLTVAGGLASTSGAITVSANNGGTISGEVGGLTTTGPITISNAAGALNVSGNVRTTGAFSYTGPVTFTGSVNAGSLSVPNTASIDVSSPITVNSVTPTGTINVVSGGLLSVSSLAADLPTLNVEGGTVNVAGAIAVNNSGSFNFNSGTVVLQGNRTYNSGATGIAQRVLTGSSLGAGKTVEVTGTLTMGSLYTLNGGTLKVGRLTNSYNLTFTKGTLEVTNADIEVDSAGLLGDTVQLTSGQSLVASDTVGGAPTGNVNVTAGGILELSGGRLTGNTAVNNSGEIRVSSATSRISGGSLVNTGVIVGSAGRVEAEVTNGDDNGPAIDGGDTGAIGEIRVGTGGNLRFTGDVTNLVDGRIEAQGGTIDLSNGMVNEGRVLVSNGGNLRLSSTTNSSNPGSIEVSGSANIYGDIQNSSGPTEGGKIIVSGGGVVNFFDDVWNGPGIFVGPPENGVHAANSPELRISGGSAAVIFGAYKGSGRVTGQGTLIYEGGDFSPGDSPRIFSVEGNFSLGTNATTVLELAGATAGYGGYDQLQIGGIATLGGTLDVVLLDGYWPTFGTQFDVITAGQLIGDFSALNLPGGSEYWDVSRTSTGLTLTAIPEPAALMAGAFVAAAALKRRARRNTH
jgi:hypothetical protein